MDIRVRNQLIGSFTADVLAGQTTDLGTIDLQNGTFRGTVMWHGTPASDAEINGLSIYEAARGEITFLQGASYAFTLPVGTHTFGLYDTQCFAPQQPALATTTFDLTAGAATTADLDLTDTAGKVTGTITLNGVPPSGVALRSELSVAASFSVRAELQKLVPGDDLGADKAAFDISVDPAGRLERGGAGGDGPRMSVLLADCEECHEVEQPDDLAEHGVRRVLSCAHLAPECGCFFGRQLRQLGLQPRAEDAHGSPG